MENWWQEFATSSARPAANSYLSEDGRTQFYLPGDPEYKDARGYTMFPELPGQSRDPIYKHAIAGIG